MKAKHTATPWFADSEGAIWRRDPKELYENGGGVAGDAPIARASAGKADWENKYPVEANAKFIVRACNAHDDLIADLRRIGEMCRIAQVDRIILEAISAALAKAGAE
jgi:hypothetical protein